MRLIGQAVHDFDYDNFKRYGRTYVDYLFPGTSFLCISDPQDVRQLLVSDFSTFSQRDDLSWPRYVREGIFFAHGSRWKRLRSLISPVFTGSRIKLLYPQIQIKSDACVNNILKQIESGRGRSIPMRRLAKCTTIDFLVQMLLSVDLNSFASPCELSDRLGVFYDVHPLVVLAAQLLPVSVQKLLNIHLINYGSLRHFVAVVKQSMVKRRAEPDLRYDDLLQMLMQAQHSVDGSMANQPSTDRLNDDELVAQAVVFFFAGIESSMSLLCKILLQLALNDDWQTKVFDDLQRLYPEHDIPMDRLFDSAPLNAVVSEVQRDSYAVVRLLRMAAKDTVIAGVNVRKGQNVCVPLYNLHHDPQLFPEPFTFRPERFLCPESGHFLPVPVDLPDNAFIPFGDGPRKCIAYRFAQIQLRLILIQVLRRFRVSITEHTVLPLKAKRMSLVNNFDDFCLGFQGR
jgi:cytochrome P450 family 6